LVSLILKKFLAVYFEFIEINGAGLFPRPSKLRINISRSPAVGGITADIFKTTLPVAAWAYFWRCWQLNGVAAFQALPEGVQVFYLRFFCFFTHYLTIELLN
jgi:hypothetical protein